VYRTKFIIRTYAIALIAIAIATFASSDAQAESARQSVTVYGGPATRRYVSEIFLHGHFDVDGTTLGLAYDRRVFDLGAGFALEIEVQVTHFFMSFPYTSVAAGVGIRYDTSRWIGRRSSFAVYSGPSYADDGGSKNGRFLEYVTVQFAVSINRSPWDGVIRMYHRSGTFGLYGKDTDAGSMLGIGLRRRF
jgi:hypothetical protein